MQTSVSIDKISKALIDFQGLIEGIEKSANNPFFKSKYVPLSAILKAIKQPLIDCGLSFSQLPDEDGLTTILMHESGEYISATYRLSPAKNDPQGWGAAITYARRYTLTSILGLNTDEDDDGNSATLKSEYLTLIDYAAKICTNREQLADIFEICKTQQKNSVVRKIFEEKGNELKNG